MTTATAPLPQTSFEVAAQRAYNRLFADGKLIDLTISMWSMTTGLNKEDLGVEKVPTFAILGKKYLIDPKVISEFKAIEAKARKLLYKYSLSFPVAQAHFVPKSRLAEVINGLEGYKAEFTQKVYAFFENYETHKAEFLAKLTEEERELFKNAYPTADRLRQKFSFTITLFEISLPKKFKQQNYDTAIQEQEAARQIRERLEQQFERDNARLMQQAESFVMESATLVRKEVSTMVLGLVKRIQNKKNITEENITNLKKLIENFKAMNFFNDRQLNNQLISLENTVNNNESFESGSEALAELSQQLNRVAAEAETALDDTITKEYFRDMDT